MRQPTAVSVLVSVGAYAWCRRGDVVEWCRIVARPIVKLAEHTAGSVYDGLFTVPVALKFSEYDKSVVENARLSFFHFDRDGATALQSLLTYRRNNIPRSSDPLNITCSSEMTCSNHDNAHTDNHLIDFMSVQHTLSTIYRGVSLVRTGWFFCRMILAVTPVIKKIARTMPESCRPREPHPYNLALVDFMVQQFTPYTQRANLTNNGKRHTTLVPDLETEPFKKTKAGIAYHNDLMELASLLPWPWYDGIIIFGEVSPVLLKRIQGLFKKTFFSSMPETFCVDK